MTKEEILNLITTRIDGQGNQLDTTNALPLVLRGIIGLITDTEGNMTALETSHKDNIVEAINEVVELLETPDMVISMLQSNAERKIIYDRVKEKLHLAKNIVFYTPVQNLYYKVNAYNMINDILHLHATIEGSDVDVKVSYNGSISV